MRRSLFELEALMPEVFTHATHHPLWQAVNTDRNQGQMTHNLPEAASGETKNTDQNFDLGAENRQTGNSSIIQPPLPLSLFILDPTGDRFPLSSSSASPYHPGPDRIRESSVGSYCHEPDLASVQPVLDNSDFGLDCDSANTGAFGPS
jgi:hypothetical protein